MVMIDGIREILPIANINLLQPHDHAILVGWGSTKVYIMISLLTKIFHDFE